MLSAFLPKDVFGEFNWSLAVLTFITSILSLRLEQIVVRRVAAGEDPSRLLTLFTGHIVWTGLLFYLVLLAAHYFFPGFFNAHTLLLVLAISHLLSFFSLSFKQIANGKEKFRLLAWMSSIANLVRMVALLIIVLLDALSIRQVLLVYIGSSLLEAGICFLLCKYRLSTTLSWQYSLRDYFLLLRESWPQAGMVFLNATIARIDWILLGFFAGPFIIAEYSFAYKVFELSPFPLLILAPVLLSRFSRFFSTGSPEQLLTKKKELGLFIRLEMIAATFIPLVLNIIWTPLVDGLTGNKYGAVNATTFLILSFCIPFLYLNNIYWSVLFAQNRLKKIFLITLVTFSVILIGNLVMIPLYAGTGAAVAYLLGTLAEYINYRRASFLSQVRESWTAPLLCIGNAVLSGIGACQLAESLPWRLFLAISFYFILLLATRQLQKSDIKYIQLLFNKK